MWIHFQRSQWMPTRHSWRNQVNAPSKRSIMQGVRIMYNSTLGRSIGNMLLLFCFHQLSTFAYRAFVGCEWAGLVFYRERKTASYHALPRDNSKSIFFAEWFRNLMVLGVVTPIWRSSSFAFSLHGRCWQAATEHSIFLRNMWIQSRSTKKLFQSELYCVPLEHRWRYGTPTYCRVFSEPCSCSRFRKVWYEYLWTIYKMLHFLIRTDQACTEMRCSTSGRNFLSDMNWQTREWTELVACNQSYCEWWWPPINYVTCNIVRTWEERNFSFYRTVSVAFLG